MSKASSFVVDFLPNLSSRGGGGSSAAAHQRHVDQSSTETSRPRNFYRGKKCEIWPQFSTPLASQPLECRNGAKYLKSKSKCGGRRWLAYYYPNVVQFGSRTPKIYQLFKHFQRPVA